MVTAQTRSGRFAWESPRMGGASGSCHAIELPFVFGKLGDEGTDLFTGDGPEAERVSHQTMKGLIQERAPRSACSVRRHS